MSNTHTQEASDLVRARMEKLDTEANPQWLTIDFLRADAKAKATKLKATEAAAKGTAGGPWDDGRWLATVPAALWQCSRSLWQGSSRRLPARPRLLL